MSYWLWYPGDLERYYALKQNFSRVERGCEWPAFWKSEGFRNRIVFRRNYELSSMDSFTVYSVPDARGYVQVDDRKYAFGSLITCNGPSVRISIHVGCIGCMPAVFVDGDQIRSDEGWEVSDFDAQPVPAAHK